MKQYWLTFPISLLLVLGCRAGASLATPAATPAPVSVPSDTPTALPGGLPFDSINMMDASSGWAWKGESQLFRTDDGGSTWAEIHLQGKRLVTGAFFLSGQEAWLPGVPDIDMMQAVFHTADGGKTWAELGKLHGPNVSLSFSDPKHGWSLNGTAGAGNVFYDVWQTLDGGRTWTQLQPSSRGGPAQGPAPNAIHVASGDSLSFSLPASIWIASGAGISTPYAGLTVSWDNGRNWQDLNPTLPNDLVVGQPPVTTQAPQFPSEGQAFLPVTVGPRLVFFSSRDEGHSWALLPAALPATQMMPRVQFVSSTEGFAACGASLCSTQDAALTWQQVPTPFSFDPSQGPVFATQFDFVDAQTGWAIVRDAGGNMKLVKTTDEGKRWFDLNPRLGF